MSKLDELRAARNAAEAEMGRARSALSEAQSRFAEAKKAYGRARDAYLDEAAKSWEGFSSCPRATACAAPSPGRKKEVCQNDQ